MMEQKCPFCGEDHLEYFQSMDEWVSDNECIRQWDVRCAQGHGFIISEVHTVTSRLVAKDNEELDALIVKEEEEDKCKYTL